MHYRLIEGFSAGFGFNAVAVALIAATNPLSVIPAGLFFGCLEAGALAMQREVGVPSSLVHVIQGLTIARAHGWGLPVSSYVIQMLPYLAARALLAGIGRSSRMPAAIGVPFVRS